MSGTAWKFTETQCEVCNGLFLKEDHVAEMYDPNSDAGSLIVHHHCGQVKGLELA